MKTRKLDYSHPMIHGIIPFTTKEIQQGRGCQDLAELFQEFDRHDHENRKGRSREGLLFIRN